MDWNQGWNESWKKWERLSEVAAARDAQTLRNTIGEICGFCQAAQSEIDALGIPKVRMDRCDFCRGFLDYGGCEEPIRRILAGLDAGDWTAVESEIVKVQGILREIAAA